VVGRRGGAGHARSGAPPARTGTGGAVTASVSRTSGSVEHRVGAPHADGPGQGLRGGGRPWFSRDA
jgi:hypothetical protein